LSLRQRYLYILFRPIQYKFFALHIDCVSDKGNVVRISFGNLYKEVQTTHGAVILPLAASKGWTILMIDLQHILSSYMNMTLDHLRSLQFCSHMHVRGAFSSDNKYNAADLPREMAVHIPYGTCFDDHYEWIAIPEEDIHDLGDVGKKSREKSSHTRHTDQVALPGTMSLIPSQLAVSARGDNDLFVGGDEDHENAAIAQSILRPDPILNMLRMNRAGTVCKFSLSGETVIFPAGHTIVTQNLSTAEQSVLIGHSSEVKTFDISEDARLLASSQSGPAALIRLWDLGKAQCVSLIGGFEGGVSHIALSKDGLRLVALGKNRFKRTCIGLWNVGSVLSGSPPKLIARVHVDHAIHKIEFSPFEKDHLVTVGPNNVWFWRLRGDQLRGCPVDLREHGNHDFLDLAFEVGYGSSDPVGRRVYVSTASGAVLQIAYGNRSLECVFLLHQGAIHSLAVNEGYCVTGSADRFLRVWPLDFSSFLLEAEHEGEVVGVDISLDGLRVAAVTNKGTLGMLELPTQRYTTLIRSHIGPVMALATDPVNREFATASSDHSVRIWDFDTCDQLYEFDSPSEVPTCLCYHPLHYMIVAGFSNGIIRVFDIATTSLIEEHHCHRGQVNALAFSSDGTRLFSSGEDGVVVVYDCQQAYQPIRMLTGFVSMDGKLALSPDGSLLALPIEDGKTITLLDAASLESRGKISLKSRGPSVHFFQSVRFSPDGESLFAASVVSNSLFRFSLPDCTLQMHVSNVHSGDITDMNVSPNGQYLFTTGSDGMVKVWDAYGRGAPNSRMRPFQAFVGHSGAATAVTTSKDGRIILTGGANQEFIQWSFLGDASMDVSAYIDRRVVDAIRRQEAGDVQEVNRSANAPSLPQPRLQVESEEVPIVETSSEFQQKVNALNKELNSRADRVGVISESERKAMHDERLQRLASEQRASTALQSISWQRSCGFSGNKTANPAVFWNMNSDQLLWTLGGYAMMEQMSSGSQQLLLPPTGQIACLAVTADFRRVAIASTGSDEGESQIVIYDLLHQRNVQSLRYHTTEVSCLAFNELGTMLVSVGKEPENAVVVWDVTTGKMLAVSQTECPLSAVAWDPQAEVEFATVGLSAVYFWMIDNEAGALRVHVASIPAELPSSPPLFTCCCYERAKNVSLFHAGTSDGHLVSWCTEDNELSCLFSMARGSLQALASCDGYLLVGGETALQVWQPILARNGNAVEDWKLAFTPAGLPSSPVCCLHFEEGQGLKGVVGTENGCVCFVDATVLGPSGTTALVQGHQDVVATIENHGPSTFFSFDRTGGLCRWSSLNRRLQGMSLVSSSRCMAALAPLTADSAATASNPTFGLRSADVVVGTDDGSLFFFTDALETVGRMSISSATLTHLSSQYATGLIMAGDGEGNVLRVDLTRNSSSVDVCIGREIVGMASAAKSDCVAVASSDGVLRILEAGTVVDAFKPEGPVILGRWLMQFHCAEHEELLTFVSPSNPTKVIMYDPAEKNVRAAFEMQFPVTALCVEERLDALLVGMVDGSLVALRLSSSERICRKKIHRSAVTSICVVDDCILSGSEAGDVVFWLAEGRGDE
jgi:WD repeat-containing protein 90